MASLPNPTALDAPPFRGAASLSSSPMAYYSIARDIEEESDAVESSDDDSDSTVRPDGEFRHSMISSYRRPSAVAAGSRPLVLTGHNSEHRISKREREEIQKQERNLLRDNKLLPPKDRGRTEGVMDSLKRTVSRASRRSVSSENGAGPSETSPLIGTQSPQDVSTKWEEAVMAGLIQTTWQREAKTLLGYSRSLIVTFLLQYSLTVASIFTVGRLGTIELGAVSLGSMSANITGYAIYQGLATSLDTLCSQAYGSGKKKLVGLQMQRMVYFLWLVTIPVGIIWLSSSYILRKIVPEPEIAELAGVYLKILLAGAPGYALFESGKRYLQAQGIFHATLYVLLFCAPLNAFMNWLFVWKLNMGFKGAPLAVAITDNLLPLCLFLYVRFVDGMQCWGGFSKRALSNWGPMIRLALPGLLMVEAEFLAFEILTLAASYLSTEELAAQSIVSTVTSITFYIPFPVSIAASTRIANLIGATLSEPAKLTARVALVMATVLGLFNLIMLSSLRTVIPRLFTDDPVVIDLVAKILPLCAAFQLFDALAANCGGILRGLGRQEIGGYVNLICYYAVAMPISLSTAFALHWNLYGLWTGVAIALALVTFIELWFIYKTKWSKVVEDAAARNESA